MPAHRFCTASKHIAQSTLLARQYLLTIRRFEFRAVLPHNLG
jgi:hypothetical protein